MPSTARKPRRLALEQLEPRTTPTAALLYENMVAEIMEKAPTLHPGTAWYLARMRADGSFSDLTYSGRTNASAADLHAHGRRLETLSLSLKWDDPSNAYFGSPQLQSQILKGWSYLAARGGTVSAPNWWWKSIGVPQGMAEGLVLIRDELSPTIRTQVLNKYFKSAWTPSKLDGANLTYQAPLAIVDGLLRNNPSRIREVVSRVSGELLAYGGEGIQRDLSFQQHRLNGRLNYYSGHYGLQFAEDTAQVMRWAAGTDFAFAAPAVDQHLRYLLDHLQWLTRGDMFEVASMGRMMAQPRQVTTAPLMLQGAIVDMLPLGRRTDELLSAVDRFEHGVSDANFLSGNQVLWRSDAMTHQRPEMMATLRMLSSRTLRPETAAGMNRQGFFAGDGLTLFIQDGDELGARGGQEIMPVWDWQRLPGTTVQHSGAIPYYDMFKTATNSTGASPLVGSASDGNYGVAMMDYRRGGVSLTARKSWFFFDDEVVALGADIDDAKAAAPVFTSLNQVLQDGPVTMRDASGRRTLNLGEATSLVGQAWIQHDDLGYVILDDSSRTTVQAKVQSGGGASLPVFSAWVDHGPRPQNKTYAYAVVADVSPDELDSYAVNSPIEILKNTPAVQAVRHTGLAQTQIAFYAAGATLINDTTWIAVGQPALLIVREVGEDLVITAADPLQRSTGLTIDVNRRLLGPGARWQPATQSTRISLPLATAPYLGSSVTRTFVAMSGEPVRFPAVADTFVRGGSFTGANYGSQTSLTIQNYVSNYTREGLIRFDTSAIAGEIVFAEVQLTAIGGTSPLTIAAAPLDSDAWNELAVNWYSRPASGQEIGRAVVKQGQVASFDVTSLVRQAVAGDNQFSLRLYSPTMGYYPIGLATREHANSSVQPVLEVFVRPPVVDPPPEGESLAAYLAGADAAPQVIGPLRLSDFLTATSRLSAFEQVFGPLPLSASPPLPPPVAPPPATSGIRHSRGHADRIVSEVWDPALVDLALGAFDEPEPDDAAQGTVGTEF